VNDSFYRFEGCQDHPIRFCEPRCGKALLAFHFQWNGRSLLSETASRKEQT
jgi:hypothetical protein